MNHQRLQRHRARLLAIRPECFYCGDPLDSSTATIDHYVARAHGGGNCRRNLVLACLPCNRLKADAAAGQFRDRWDEHDVSGRPLIPVVVVTACQIVEKLRCNRRATGEGG